MIFWSNVWVWGPKFPMKLFREGHKVLHEGGFNNQELPFQIRRDSCYFCGHNKKKHLIFAEGALFGRFQVPLNSPNIKGGNSMSKLLKRFAGQGYVRKQVNMLTFQSRVFWDFPFLLPPPPNYQHQHHQYNSALKKRSPWDVKLYLWI